MLPSSLPRLSARMLPTTMLRTPQILRRSGVSAWGACTPSATISRPYHSDPMTGEPTGYHDLDASALVIQQTKSPKQPPPSSTLVFGHSFSDHMLTVSWNSASGWAPPSIQPYAPLTLDPSSVIFHYAPSLFEGMKAYKDVQGRVRLFRPDMNMARLNSSATRIALPVSVHTSKSRPS